MALVRWPRFGCLPASVIRASLQAWSLLKFPELRVSDFHVTKNPSYVFLSRDMKITPVLGLRRIINSAYHPFETIPKQDRWHTRERLSRFTAWQYAGNRSCYKHGVIRLNKVFCYLDMQRRDEKRLELFDAEQRLTAALAEHHFEYKHFRNMLDKAHILLDNIVLSQMAIYEPRTFQSLVALAKEMAMKDGRSVVPDDEFKFEVHLDDSLFGEPFLKARIYPRGPAENHKIMPRKLKPEEY